MHINLRVKINPNVAECRLELNDYERTTNTVSRRSNLAVPSCSATRAFRALINDNDEPHYH